MAAGFGWGRPARESMKLESTITCPFCGHRTTAPMPVDACIYFFDCPSCGNLIKPKAGDCCVFCSYGDVPCPPVQQARAESGEHGRCC